MTSLPGEERFRLALVWLKPIEGGWWPGGRRDPNPTMRGITQRTYDAFRQRQGLPVQSVRGIADAEHDQIYRAEYWVAGRCSTMAWPLALVHFDACVNHGVGNARKLLKRLPEQTPAAYITLRRAFYHSILERHPDWEPNRAGWAKRMDKLTRLLEKL